MTIFGHESLKKYKRHLRKHIEDSNDLLALTGDTDALRAFRKETDFLTDRSQKLIPVNAPFPLEVLQSTFQR